MDKDRSALPVSAVKSSNSKLRYPLRSAAKSKEGGPVIMDASNSNAKRGRPPPVVSKSVSALDISGKQKLAKPPRRFSTPTKPIASPRQAPFGSVTPISESRLLRRSSTQGKSDSPVSDVSKPISRRKFSALYSVSYWLSQIKLSESASKHSISLGFFKLAMESGCQPLDRVRDELKSYVRRHNLVTELGEPAKDLLQMYNIAEDVEKLKVSETCSQSSVEGNRISDKESNKRERVQKRKPASKNKGSYKERVANAVPVKDTNGNNAQKKSRLPRRMEYSRGNGKKKSSAKKSMTESVDSPVPLPTGEASFESKENTNTPPVEGASVEEEISAN